MSDKQLIESWRARMGVIKNIRRFWDEQGFEEMIVPVLQPGVPAEPTIYPFVTSWDRRLEDGGRTGQQVFMPLSPERAMKHYLARGMDKIYSIGHCMRNMEAKGSSHHPEFLMLEWYRSGCDYHQIMADTKELIGWLAEGARAGEAQRAASATEKVRFAGRNYSLVDWPTLSVEEMWQATFGGSIADFLDDESLRALAGARGYDTTGDWEQIFNQLFLNEIETQLPADKFYFLLDFPAKLSPLCRPRADKDWLAERFEVYCGALELGNGNSEQLEEAVVRALF
ncbi:hypothetical protein IJJ12_00030, partial [bacterium]|nr:hypothetical protein [bacterium]